MTNRLGTRTLAGVLVVISLTTGCATTNIGPPSEAPAPAITKLSAFDMVVLRKAIIAPAYADHPANQKALVKIDENLQKEFSVVFPSISMIDPNAAAPTKAGTLVIEPKIQKIKFIGGAARFWSGAMSGSSAVLMQVTFIDAATKKVIASPTFFQRAAAYGAAWSFGATDRDMLVRIAQVATSYARENL